ncbi:MAG: TetR/AcrR family transcriptional regulator [Formivibrio sp.]|nr:TetR/AcrR family transcriptional regulator [Formivibrio sp.]
MRIKSEVRRQAIMDVATEVFREHGFEQASMSEITARVGGSKATLYSYFPSKEALFVEVMHRCAKAHMEGVFAGLDPAKDVRTTLQTFGEKFVTFISEAKLISVLRVVYSEAGRTDVGRQFYERGPKEGMRKFADYFEKCVALGKFRPENAMVAAQHFTALLRAEIMDPLLMGACNADGLPSLDEVVARSVDIFLRAYGTK